MYKHFPMPDPPDLTLKGLAYVEYWVENLAATLAADLEEAPMQELIVVAYEQIKRDQELLLEVWRRLDSKQRSAIKKFLERERC